MQDMLITNPMQKSAYALDQTSALYLLTAQVFAVLKAKRKCNLTCKFSFPSLFPILASLRWRTASFK